MATLTRAPEGRILVSCSRCTWTFTTRFGPVALRLAHLHDASGHGKRLR